MQLYILSKRSNIRTSLSLSMFRSFFFLLPSVLEGAGPPIPTSVAAPLHGVVRPPSGHGS